MNVVCLVPRPNSIQLPLEPGKTCASSTTSTATNKRRDAAFARALATRESYQRASCAELRRITEQQRSQCQIQRNRATAADITATASRSPLSLFFTRPASFAPIASLSLCSSSATLTFSRRGISGEHAGDSPEFLHLPQS